MTRDWSSVGEVPRDAVAGMVEHLRPSWTVETVEPSEHGTDFVAMLRVSTPGGQRRVVLKAATAEWVQSETVLAEHRLLSVVGEQTRIPVPRVFGACEQHPAYPTPFYLMSYVEGRNYEGEGPPAGVQRRTLRDAGRHLAALHELDTPVEGRVGRVGARDGELVTLDTGEFTSGESFHPWLLSSYEEHLDELANGGSFPELADDHDRFADIVPDLRAYLRATIPNLPEPNPPVLCHSDYRYGNLLVDPETGETRAVLDWGLMTVGAPAYNLAETESLMLAPEEDGPELTAELRETFRSAYATAREGWRFDDGTLRRMELYRLLCRIDAMSCLPLWHSPGNRDERAAEHREFVRPYL